MIGFSFIFADSGFDIPNRFVVGYAIDYNERFRELSVGIESGQSCFPKRWSVIDSTKSAWNENSVIQKLWSKKCSGLSNE